MADRPARKGPQQHTMTVLRKERLTPHMIRLTIGGEGFDSFTDNGYADQYVKVLFRIPGVEYAEPLDMTVVRETLPREQWPVARTYTVRAVDTAARELTVDFVHHGDEGLAGPWAAAVEPGAGVILLGPGGAYSPAADADWHLLVGDESALPAIAASLEKVPAGVPAYAFIEVDGPAEEQQITTDAKAEIVWVHRDGAHAGTGDLLLDAVTAFEFPTGTVSAFVHGEAGQVKKLRALLKERGVERDQLSVSGYWRYGMSDEEHRQLKQQEKAAEQA